MFTNPPNQAVANRPNQAVIADGLCVRRGRREVLRNVSLSVPAGQIVGLLGPSGCGKSTLLRAIMGVQVVTGGRLSVLGSAAGSIRLRRRIGYMTQMPSVYDDLTIKQNLHFFRRILGVAHADVDRVIQATDLTTHAGALVGALSGGQRSRVSLAIALLGKPELLVLDEPTVGLDPALRVDLWAFFRRLAAQGVSLLVSSHAMDEAAHCDRLLLMRQGEILADETPHGLLAATGAESVEEAFLSLIADRGERVAGRHLAEEPVANEARI